MSELETPKLYFLGVWKAGVPELKDGIGNQNDDYIVADDNINTDFGSGNIFLNRGDMLLYDKGIWKKIKKTVDPLNHFPTPYIQLQNTFMPLESKVVWVCIGISVGIVLTILTL